MEINLTDLDVLKRLSELSKLEQKPTPRQKKEFIRLKGELERRLEESLALEERTIRLVRFLKAA